MIFVAHNDVAFILNLYLLRKPQGKQSHYSRSDFV